MLRLAAEGLTNDQTGARLLISPETVKSHRRKIIIKLGARNTLHAVAIGAAAGYLLERSEPETESPPLTAGQRRALHAKTNALAREGRIARSEARATAIRLGQDEFGRELVGFSDLNQIEASWLLDRLETEIERIQFHREEGDE